MSLIMLVDDDADILRLTERWVVKAGYETITATSGKDALEMLGMIRPDLIILDYYMPEMNGPEVYEAVRADEKYKDIPIIFRTGVEDTNASGEMDRLKPDAVVSKGDGKTALLDAVSRII